MSKLPYILGGTAVAGLAYYLYQQNQATTAAASTTSPTVNTALALPPAPTTTASSTVSDPTAVAAVSAALKKANMAIGPLQAPTQDNSDSISAILGTLPGTVLHFWPNTDVLALVSPINGHPTPLFAPPPGEGYVSTLDLLYEVSMGGKTVIYQQVPGAVPTNVTGGAPYIAPVYTYFRLIEPTAPVPAGWQVFFAPGAADAVYRAGGLNVAAMLNVAIPASSQIVAGTVNPLGVLGQPIVTTTTPSTAAPAQPLAQQVAFLQGVAGFTATTVQGSNVVQMFPAASSQPLLGSWNGQTPVLSVLLSAAQQGFQIYVGPPPAQPVQAATLMGQTSVQAPNSVGLLYLVAPGAAAPAPGNAVLVFNPADVAPAMTAAGINPTSVSTTTLPVAPATTVPTPWGVTQPIGMPWTTALPTVAVSPVSSNVQAQVLQALVGRSATPTSASNGVTIFVLNNPADPTSVGTYPALNVVSTGSGAGKYVYHDAAPTDASGNATGAESIYLADNGVAPTATATLAFAPGDVAAAAMIAGIDLSSLASVPLPPSTTTATTVPNTLLPFLGA